MEQTEEIARQLGLRSFVGVKRGLLGLRRGDGVGCDEPEEGNAGEEGGGEAHVLTGCLDQDGGMKCGEEDLTYLQWVVGRIGRAR